MKWNGNLSDAASKNFKTLTSTIQQNVRFITCQLRHLIYTKLVLLSFSQRVGPFIPTPGKEVIILNTFSDGEAPSPVHPRQCPLRDKRVEKLP